ncbi:STAS domain-containing protein [Amycolatopsis sp. WQ 127309]|uniref:STAS domain-containing protein n=1 Tax=Amycolatopsis sp. WQ 127309 TaxID=2932773 RepID=UPI001FF11FEC|nr:STAS domain-containing protein [Amycolatopsis sp. WQ 127309]UOZ03337.1 hypothetical protein MUY22_31340 [Amycolatopsis sp. WQ 127309]
MTFSLAVRADSSRDVLIAVSGDVVGVAPADLLARIVAVIELQHPETLRVSLAGVTALGSAGIHALLGGYTSAVENGTTYHVQHAIGPVRRILDLAGVREMLADSNDVGALLLAKLRLRDPVSPASDEAPPPWLEDF